MTWQGPAGHGEMARAVRSYDWTATPLGPLTSWPHSLRSFVSLCLDSPSPSFLWWGLDLIQFYNDAALPIIRAKHPAALGAPAHRMWADGWAEIGDLLQGSAFSCTPVRDDTGVVAGIFCHVVAMDGAAIDLHEARLAHDSFERGVRERTVEVRSLLQRLVSIQEEERRRIARDIHDQLGQQMTALRMNLEALHLRVARDERLLEQMTRTVRLAEELDQSIDFLTWELRPAALDHLGLSSALRNLVTGWSERFGIAGEFDVQGDDEQRLPGDVETNLYRVAQEALHNVVKHAQAAHVTVLLERNDDETVLVIEDDGRGFDPVKIRELDGNGGLGLVSMRERATLAGGQFEVESRADRGTSIFIRVPTNRGGRDGA